MLLTLCAWIAPYAQSPDAVVTEREVTRIISILASDSLRGRGNFDPAQQKAADFIVDEFSGSGLYPLPGFHNYSIPFLPARGLWTETDALVWNGNPVPSEQFMYLQARPGPYPAARLQDFSVIRLNTCFTDELPARLSAAGRNVLVWTDKRQPDGVNIFPRSFQSVKGSLRKNILLVYAGQAPDSIRLEAQPGYTRLAWNIAGILPGRSRPGEVVLFSAHYDHEGVLPHWGKDSIMNGANDNASGTTVLLMLARYFAARNDNERTLIFCAFSGEELGLVGSKAMAPLLETDSIVAAINLEMLGVPQYGKKRVFITGRKYSSLPDGLRKQLVKNGLKVIPEPDEEKQLFLRSDNYPFAQEGVPAHTIMASDDGDRCYHKVCDEVQRIDIPNLTALARAIAAACGELVNGTFTPGRINTKALPE